MIQDVVLAGDEVDGRDALRVVFPDVPAVGGTDRGPIDDGEDFPELVVQFSPPLVGEVGGRDDERALDQAPELEFLDAQPAHDRLAGPGIVGDQKPDAGLREQMAVNGIHLVRQRIDLRHRDGEVRVVLEGQPDAVGFGGEPEMGRVAIQGGQLACQGDLDYAVELLGVEQLVPEPLRVQADRLNLDPVATSLGRQAP